MLAARSGQAEPARIASGEAADRPPTQISYFGHELNDGARSAGSRYAALAFRSATNLALYSSSILRISPRKASSICFF